eukprot:scaffold275217_cov32-Tisochrysis_lutea.AAC.2
MMSSPREVIATHSEPTTSVSKRWTAFFRRALGAKGPLNSGGMREPLAPPGRRAMRSGGMSATDMSS